MKYDKLIQKRIRELMDIGYSHSQAATKAVREYTVERLKRQRNDRKVNPIPKIE